MSGGFWSSGMYGSLALWVPYLRLIILYGLSLLEDRRDGAVRHTCDYCERSFPVHRLKVKRPDLNANSAFSQ